MWYGVCMRCIWKLKIDHHVNSSVIRCSMLYDREFSAVLSSSGIYERCTASEAKPVDHHCSRRIPFHTPNRVKQGATDTNMGVLLVFIAELLQCKSLYVPSGAPLEWSDTECFFVAIRCQCVQAKLFPKLWNFHNLVFAYRDWQACGARKGVLYRKVFVGPRPGTMTCFHFLGLVVLC